MGILDEASFKLINLIIRYEHDSLHEVHQDIFKTQEDLKSFKEIRKFQEQDKKMNAILNYLKTEIMETKKSKFTLEKQDYANKEVYKWYGHINWQSGQYTR